MIEYIKPKQKKGKYTFHIVIYPDDLEIKEFNKLWANKQINKVQFAKTAILNRIKKEL